MSGASTGEESASTSCIVSVDAEPSASRIPELEVVLPGVIVSTLEPSELISGGDLAGRSLTQPNRHDDAGDADQDAEHGQEGAQAVAAHPVDAGTDRLEPAHRMLWLSRWRSSCSESSPSRMPTTRSGRRGDLDVVGDENQRAPGLVQFAHESHDVGG